MSARVAVPLVALAESVMREPRATDVLEVEAELVQPAVGGGGAAVGVAVGGMLTGVLVGVAVGGTLVGVLVGVLVAGTEVGVAVGAGPLPLRSIGPAA